MLQTEWLDVPTGQDARHPGPTWMAFSESADVCLSGLTVHVAQHVDDRAHLERIVTKVFVDNLDLLVSKQADGDKLDRMRSAADALIERRSRPGRDSNLRVRRARHELVTNGRSDD